MPTDVGVEGAVDGDADDVGVTVGEAVGDAETLGSGVTTPPDPPGIDAGLPGKLIG